jgi:undecaprenyl diphosphate synthase
MTNTNIPRHIAVIMDGNGRWAKKLGLNRIEGHKAGAQSVRKIVEQCRRRGVRHLTLFSFSTENWQRSASEVAGLMELFSQYLKSELGSLQKNGIRLRAIGDIGRLPFAVRSLLKSALDKTAENDGMDLILAISYGGREEIINAAKIIADKVRKGLITIEQIDNQEFSKCLWTEDIPDPDLLIRTSGEMRVSNFLLWQIAYSEIVVTEELWPEFNEESLDKCLLEYSQRERRFGLTSEQVSQLAQK